MKRKALYLDDSEKELDALLENEDFWKPGKSEWDSEILDITNKQRELEESQYVNRGVMKLIVTCFRNCILWLRR